MFDRVNENCGVFGAYDYKEREVSSFLYWGMISQNHRGHQSYGFLTYDGEDFDSVNDTGLLPVKDNGSENEFKNLNGSVGIGHVRYATSGSSEDLEQDIQPFVEEKGDSKIAIGYNGNLVNKGEISKGFRDLRTNCDTELLCRIFMEGAEGTDLFSGAKHCMERIEGSFSVVGVDNEGRLFAFRDPKGIKPLCYGRGEGDDVYAISSESVGLSINGFEYIDEVSPGEMLVFSDGGLERKQVMESESRAFCSFEFDYFARPDAVFGGTPVYKIREEFGRNLARENPDITEKADMIVSIPQTANDIAYGLHEKTGLPWERAVRKHRYVTSRAFISSSGKRGEIIDKKINVDWSQLEGKDIAIAEDSIVRGTTSTRVTKKMKELGVGDIHFYLSFPRIISPCFYGIDMTTFEELIGSDHTPEEVAQEIGVESVNYQSIEGFVEATGMDREELCLGCITMDYPTDKAQELAEKFKAKFEKGIDESGRIYER